MESQHIERKIVTGMIVSTEFLNNIISSFNPKYLVSKASRNIAEWCIDYYNKYEQAPKEEIEDFLESFRIKNLDKDEAEDYIQLLDSLSKDYNEEDYNIQYLTDQAYQYFGKQSVQLHIDELSAEIKRDNIGKAKELINTFNVVEKPQVKGVDPFDTATIKNAFRSANESIINYTGDMGDFFNDELYKEAFVVALAPAKKGKTSLLIELSVQALQQGNKVAFFQAGDLTEDQFNQRFYTYLFKRNYKEKYCKEHYSPIPDCVKNQRGTCPFAERESSVSLFESMDDKTYNNLKREDYEEALKVNNDYVPCTHCHRNPNPRFYNQFEGCASYRLIEEKKPLSYKDVVKGVEGKFKSLLGNFKLCTYSSDSLRPKDIKLQLLEWEKFNDFVPDVLVIDYIDIMTPDVYVNNNERANRNNINKGLRRLSQDHHVCLITATQADTNAMDKESLSEKNFNEDRRILDHLTCMIALNQTPQEKNKRIMRLSKLLSRTEDNDSTKQLVCLQNLNIGRFVLKSFFKSREEKKQ